ncbi:iron-binding protein [Candidatus Photodesmus katoptron]|uniref:Iron-binding protein IscA n=1 Tax=Candidatus Photodesmus katoptron Akat1 TaxID=1236703 RepID=S3DZJ0_9GAMM|nr:iron-sulfur cluster assembly protein IscA [Candidatus Photodesmus katoptron]EPE37336.1 iron-sulfur cluster assembly protein IscA [Candidatus Photodesmus katoptron Akat1]KEY89993.1 iron-binding protein [Candidatus Photodesmus katoptron]
MAITMTEIAARRIKSCLKNRGSGIGLRVGIKASGCSGMTYFLEVADTLNKDDKVFECCMGVKLIIDSRSLLHLDGTKLNYVKNGLNEGFEFDNPNVKSKCGCGESFNV